MRKYDRFQIESSQPKHRCCTISLPFFSNAYVCKSSLNSSSHIVNGSPWPKNSGQSFASGVPCELKHVKPTLVDFEYLSIQSRIQACINFLFGHHCHHRTNEANRQKHMHAQRKARRRAHRESRALYSFIALQSSSLRRPKSIVIERPLNLSSHNLNSFLNQTWMRTFNARSS